ncbi:tyrosine-type recombinase/integrase [Streptomyces sp. CA-250714]|uniref:tyrosine-type recombinase/integrase n=1 Tax=Streptomyces sp. CA-250714 TaxID=3240060 RepID=UPI003D8E1634
MLTYDVRIYSIETRTGRPKPYRVRWLVGSGPHARKHSKSYRLKPQADGRRSELMEALRRGEQFDTEQGLPASELRAREAKEKAVTWYEHTCAFIEKKWTDAPGKSRRNFADALASITPAMVNTNVKRPDPRVLRRALYSWAYNKKRWEGEEEPPRQWAEALAWLEKHSVLVSDFEDPKTVRKALEALSRKLDGGKAAARTAKRRRACLSDALGVAVEAGYFTIPVNPIGAVKWTPPKTAEEVDPDSVANPRQVRRLLTAVREQGERGERLEAFFGCLYYAAMRPAEAINLKRSQCHLPDKGWGTLKLRKGVVYPGRDWTDDGASHEERGLKARAEDDTRPVPIPPTFVRLLRAHLDEHGTAPDGRLFRTNRNGLLQDTGYGEVWARARGAALSEEEAASPLARRPYDLRHAGVSLWLSSGVDPAECARRAGHSLNVLFRVYAKVLAQAQDQANSRIEAAMKEWGEE